MIHRLLGSGRDWPLHDAASSRRIELQALAAHAPHALMRAAGLGVARLVLAAAPHAQRVWVACGPGNNGGDGLEAAMHLQRLARQVVVTLTCDPSRLPIDARDAFARAQAAGVTIQSHLALPFAPQLTIDAL